MNNWANGWVLDKTTENRNTENNKDPEIQDYPEKGEPNGASSNTENRETEIVIYYWPQLLEFVGLGMLLLSGGWLVVAARREGKVMSS